MEFLGITQRKIRKNRKNILRIAAYALFLPIIFTGSVDLNPSFSNKLIDASLLLTNYFCT